MSGWVKILILMLTEYRCGRNGSQTTMQPIRFGDFTTQRGQVVFAWLDFRVESAIRSRPPVRHWKAAFFVFFEWAVTPGSEHWFFAPKRERWNCRAEQFLEF